MSAPFPAAKRNRQRIFHMRPTKAGTIQSAVAATYRAAGGVEEAAELLGIALSTASYGTEVNDHRPGGLGVNYLDRLGRIDPAYARAIAEHFAALAGGAFTAHDQAPAQSVSQHVSAIVKEHSEAVIALNSGACPHQTRRELIEARDACSDAIRDLDHRAGILPVTRTVS